jgi:hypothetical protein
MEKLLAKRTDHEFSSGSTNGNDFLSFAKDIKKELKIVAKNLWWELIMWRPWHYYLSWFITRNNKYVYGSIWDVRHWDMNHVLLRTAKHEKDWTWWSNTYASLDNIENQTEYLLWVNF